MKSPTTYRPTNPANRSKLLRDTIRSNIIARRNSMGMTQTQIAKAAKVSTGYVNHIETGFRDPNIDMLCRLADVLGTTVQTLMMPGAFGDVRHAS
jgi:transcriptional regulator with XRE-family HTH domain